MIKRMFYNPIFFGALLFGFTTSFGVVRAACAPAMAPSYDDLDRVLIVRCQANTTSYPCFRSVLKIENGQIKSGYLNVVQGVGLRGQYNFASSRPDTGHRITALLDGYSFLTMVVPPTGRYIDGEFNLLAVRRCGGITKISNDGNIDDTAHIPWSVLLQRLQAIILSMHWAQTSEDPDYKDAASWYNESTIPDMLEPAYPLRPS